MIGLEYSDLNVNEFTWPCLLNNFINNLKHWCHCRHFYSFSFLIIYRKVLNRRDQLTRLVNIHIYMWVEQKYIKHKDLYMNIEQFVCDIIIA